MVILNPFSITYLLNAGFVILASLSAVSWTRHGLFQRTYRTPISGNKRRKNRWADARRLVGNHKSLSPRWGCNFPKISPNLTCITYTRQIDQWYHFMCSRLVYLLYFGRWSSCLFSSLLIYDSKTCSFEVSETNDYSSRSTGPVLHHLST